MNLRRIKLERVTVSWMLMGIIVILLCGNLTAALQTKSARPDIYDPELDVKAAIKSSLEQAGAENKHLLLMFGGNWCGWCHLLHGLFETNQTVKSFLKSKYILILVDIGESADKPLNRDLVKLYRTEGFGYPSLVVLDQNGRLLVSQSTGVLEQGRGHDPERVLGFLKAQAPKQGK